MTPPAPLVLVTRPQPDAARTAEDVRRHGHEPLVDPLMRVSDLPADLPALFQTGTPPQAWLATSANGAAALARHLTAGGHPLAGIPLYAVGSRTAAAARAAGFTPVYDADGAVADLASLVAARTRPAAGPLIHAAGEEVAGDLAGALAAHGHSVRRLPLYEMVPAPALAGKTVTALRTGMVGRVLLFSPRSARTFVSLATQAGVLDTMAGVTALCLSAAVARALNETPCGPVGFADVRWADRPRAAALLDLLGR